MIVEPGTPGHVHKISQDVVTVVDVAKHFKWVIKQKGMQTETVLFKIYIDSGEESFKVLASIIDQNSDPEIYCTAVEQKNNRLSGVNRVFVLAYVEDILESYKNVRAILELINLKDIQFKLCADLKIINAVLGISGHGSKYACVFCYGESSLVPGPQRTFCHLKEQH